MELNQSATPEEEEESSNNTSSSDEMFSFPGTPSTSDFEFGCVTPTSPNTNPENANHHVSPADQFFLNGRLLPHSFQPTTQSSRTSISDVVVVAPVINNFIPIRSTSLTTSRTSSIRSKEDSLMSSRSNSTSSSRSSSGMTTTTSVSCSSSARTSSSDLSERRAFQSRMVMSGREKVKIGSYINNECIKRGGCSNHHRCRGYGLTGSQRWQFNFIISPVPVLDPCSLSMRRRSGCCENGKKVMFKRKNKEVTLNVAAGSGSAAAAAACDGRKSTTENGGSWSGFWERSLRSFVKRCKSCHAMDQADVDDRDDEDGVVTSRNMEVK